METNVGREIAALQRMTVKQLRQKYVEVFDEETNGNNKAWLVKRIAWRLQARAEGGLSERARQRATELADDADLRMNPPPMKAAAPVEDEAPVRVLKFQADDRLPRPARSSPGSTRARCCRSGCGPTASSTRARCTPRSAPSPRRSPAALQRLPVLPHLDRKGG
jgi:hypothetical protein